MEAYSIKDLENLSGIKAHTIRIWEQRYHFLKPQRTQTNIRQYTPDELKTVLNVALLNKYGYRISQIDKMSADEIRQRIITLGTIHAQQERLVHELIQHLVDLNLEAFEQMLDEEIAAHGIDKTIPQLIFPFLEKIGILWMTNSVNPAQEHLVSNIIRRKLIVGIDSAYSPVKLKKTGLLFLPEGEFHELGLLHMHYLLRSRGITVFYLGASIAMKDLAFLCSKKKPDFLYTHLTSVPGNFSLDRFFRQFLQLCLSGTLIVTGQVFQQYRKKVPDQVVIRKSLPEVLDYISAL